MKTLRIYNNILLNSLWLEKCCRRIFRGKEDKRSMSSTFFCHKSCRLWVRYKNYRRARLVDVPSWFLL